MKGMANLAVLIGALLVLGIIVYTGGFLGSGTISQECILTTDYRYVGCVEDPANQPITTIPGTWGTAQYFQCPSTATRCVPLDYEARVCNTGNNCFYLWDSWGRTVSINQNINPSEWVSISAGARIKVYYTNLVNCGYSGACANGAIFPVPGASFCQFNTDKSVYDESGNIVNINPGAFKYTVPYGRAYAYPERTYCLYVPSCSADTDCTQYGQYTGTYNGQTVSYSVSGNQLSIYGCIVNPVSVAANQLGDKSKNLSTQNVNIGQCLVKYHTTAQCQPYTSSCGPNSVCTDTGNLNFQCRATVACSQDWDCGQSQQCDASRNVLRSPKCNLGQCGFTETPVSCCDNVNCPDGYYCGTDHTCYQGGQTKVACPYSCCVSDVRYFDKGCATGLTCCSDNSCHASCSGVCQQATETCNALQHCCPGLVCKNGFFGLSPIGTCSETGESLLDWILARITMFIISFIVVFFVLIILYMMVPGPVRGLISHLGMSPYKAMAVLALLVSFMIIVLFGISIPSMLVGVFS